MSGLAMPKPDSETMRRRDEIVADMRIIVPGEGVVDAVNEMRAFESDGLTAYRQLPLVVVLPETVAQVSRILKYCNERNIRVVPRGSGTSLSGGALPLEDAVLLVMSRFNRILEIDFPNRCVVAQPGVTNLGITARRRGGGLLLRARPILPDRLLDRRQRRGKFRRRALPEIRPHRQQCARHRDGADGRRGRCGSAASISMPAATTCSA